MSVLVSTAADAPTAIAAGTARSHAFIVIGFMATNVRMRMTMNNTKKLITEHGRAMYRQRGCRCEICRKDITEQKRAYRPKSDNSPVRLDAQALYDRLEREGRLFVVPPAMMRRWLANGITVYSADKVCMGLGFHPIEVWGQAFYAGCFDQEDVNV